MRKSFSRFQTIKTWLNSRHTFSFAEHNDKSWKNFGTIRVINEDFISSKAGFEMHAHENMEIITIVLKGCITHRDSLNNTCKVSSGHVQVMTTGSGIIHSEKNEEDEECNLLQIWVYPKEINLQPSYSQSFFKQIYGNQLIIDPLNRNNSLSINQDIFIWRCLYNLNKKIKLPIEIKLFNWIQVLKGKIIIFDKKEKNKISLTAGDGLGIKIKDYRNIDISAEFESEFLLFSMEEI